MLPSVFGISGLRGVVGEELHPELVCRVAAAFGALIGPGTVAVGQDSRPSGAVLAAAAAAGLAGVCRGVELLGVCPTPTVLHHTRLKQLVGAVVITASHNPEPWNGMKFADSSGRFLAPPEFVRFKEFVESGRFVRADWRQVGRMAEYRGAVQDHIRAVLESSFFAPARQRLAGRRLRVGIDAVNGAASVAAPELARAFGCEPTPLYCDPEAGAAGFPRRPEPTKENLTDLRRLVRSRRLDLGLALDPDGDRLSCVDETGQALGEEATICLAAKYVLLHRKGPVVVNLSTTRAVEDVCSDFKVRVFRSAVGEAAVTERMVETGAVLGGEGNGGVILPEVNFTRDGLVAAACVLGLMAFTGQPLSRLREELPAYHMLRTSLPLDRQTFLDRKHRLLGEFPDCRTDERDGLWLGDGEFWLHVRASNTEPIVRIIAEAREETAAHTVLARARKALV